MEANVLLALVGIVLLNGASLLTVVVKRARRDQRIEDEMKAVEKDLARGQDRFGRMEKRLDQIGSCVTEIKIGLARVGAKLDVQLDE